MKSTYYKGYELRPKKYNIPGGLRYQISVFKDGVSSFDTSYCDTLKDARIEAKEAIKGFEEPPQDQRPAFRVRPILFSTEMVHALKAGRKFQTRRIVKGIALTWLDGCDFSPAFVASDKNGLCPYGKKGDVLYVRETFQQMQDKFGNKFTAYRADIAPEDAPIYAHTWKPNIFMPKKLARLWLRVQDARIERLQDITEQDAIAEGVEPVDDEVSCPGWLDYLCPDDAPFMKAKNSFQSLINKINGPATWDANPWVWVVTFEILLDLTQLLPAGAAFDPETFVYTFTTGQKTVSECLK